MTNAETESQGKKIKPWAVGIGSIVVVIIVVAVVVTLVTSGNSDDEAAPAPSPAPSSTQQAPTQDIDASDQGWDSAIADVFGREIKVPTNGVGNALGNAKDLDSTECNPKVGAELTIQRTSGTQTVWSQDIGPSDVNDQGVPGGYARSAEAALLSASNDLTLLYSGGQIAAEVAKERLSVPDQDGLVAELEQATAKDTAYEDQPAPSAFRITSCDETRVIGDVAVPLPTDAEGNSDSSTWGVLRVSSVWEDGDWHTELGATPQPIEDEVTDLEGWTQWQF
jgi:hypothetical protein